MSTSAGKRRPSTRASRWKTVRDGAVTHLHDSAPIGWRGLTPRAVLEDGPEDYAFCRVRLRTSRSGSGLMAQCEITNTGTEPLSLRMIRWVSDISALYPPPTLRFPKSLEPSYFSTENFRGDYFATTADPQQATASYYAALRADGLFDRLRHNPLAKSRIWCSWNFGYYAKIDETEVLKQLPILRTHFPMVKFVQVDDGYQ
ncbi:MAG: hypothetical protein H0V44_10160, partial [Planctomycetes bacterium]|nr:hypothetical protein [Planctomycetota bacterium]